jgi:hypothetical protein
MSELSQEELVDLGTAANELLASEPYKLVMNMLSNSYLRDLVESGPQEKQKRETAYFKITILRELNETLEMWDAAAASVADLETAEEETE